MNNTIILVDGSDTIIGYGDKLETHRFERLHRAFSIFVFSPEDRKMLIQRRAFGKYHSGGLWSNSCCSHPRKGCLMLDELNQRLLDELNYNPDCKRISELTQPPENSFVFCGKFGYFAPFDGLAEYEIDNVFALFVQPSAKELVQINPEEAVDMQWIDLEQLVLWVRDEPNAFTPWFCPALKLAYRAVRAELSIRRYPEPKLNEITEIINSLPFNQNVSVFDVETTDTVGR